MKGDFIVESGESVSVLIQTKVLNALKISLIATYTAVIPLVALP